MCQEARTGVHTAKSGSNPAEKPEEITAACATFIARVNFPDLPAPAIPLICNVLTDFAAVTVLGAQSPTVRIVASFEPPGRSEGEARYLFSNRRGPARSAALINGVAGHAEDYDDIGIGFHPAHPSAAIAPAILAQGESMGASGRDIILAYATAYEVWSELASRDAKPHNLRGVHPTGVFGTVAAAAGVAKLLGLDEARASHAIAIAASQAAGLVANFGSMTKSFHAGRAAAAGLMSARYAAAGMTAAATVFEHRFGFLRAFSPEGEVDLVRPCRFFDAWNIIERGIGLKLYPLCYATHRILHTLTAHSARAEFTADRIAKVVYRTAPTRVIPLVHTDPQTPLEAKFSAEFAVAMAIIAGRATLAELTDDFVNRPDVRALMGKVSRDIDPTREPANYADAPDDQLEFTMTDGTILTLPLASPDDRAATLEPAVLWKKFQDCTAAAMAPASARALFDALQSLELCDNIAMLPASVLSLTLPTCSL